MTSVEQLRERAEKYLAWERGLFGLKPPAEGSALIRALSQSLIEAQKEIARLRADRDSWRRVAEGLQRNLSNAEVALASLTEERDQWKRRAEDAEGRIGNATA